MKTRIMVVDDDANMRDLMNTLLESEGYEVIPAESAAAAQAAFEGPQPDAVLLDLQLADGHGLDLLPSIKKTWPETEVIVLTGNA
ncbi:MAG TPA: response regulator, partial [Verrucomicrobiae bacterium]|nr:response regulator [Verrucomicrobiae bacterium]